MDAQSEQRRGPRRWVPIGACVLLALIAIGVALPVFSVARWAGSHELEVHVLVADADSMQPLPNVTVTLFRGPYRRRHLESPISQLSPNDVRPDLDDENTQQQLTDSDGRAVFSRRFFAAGSDSLFFDTGYVDTSDTWIQIAASGYSTVLLPLDGQSARPRDIENDLPVFVTLLMQAAPEE